MAAANIENRVKCSFRRFVWIVSVLYKCGIHTFGQSMIVIVASIDSNVPSHPVSKLHSCIYYTRYSKFKQKQNNVVGSNWTLSPTRASSYFSRQRNANGTDKRALKLELRFIQSKLLKMIARARTADNLPLKPTKEFCSRFFLFVFYFSDCVMNATFVGRIA